MNFRLFLTLSLTLACLPLQAAEEKARAPQEGWLKRAVGTLWPFKKKETDAPQAKPGQAGKVWHNLAPSLLVEPVPLKLAENRTLKVTLRLANRGKKLVQLDFPTTQRMEVLVKDQSGKTIEQWSEDQAFQNEPTLVTINPDERLEYTASVSTRDFKAGHPYTIEAFFPNFDQLRASKPVTPEP